MLIRADILRDLFGVAPKGVLHVGAHEAEEEPAYRELGWGPVVWVEMLPDKAEALRRRFADDPLNSVIEAAAWGESGIERDLYESDNKQSSSLYAPQTHLVAHPEVRFERRGRIVTRRLDEVLEPRFHPEFLNLDVQGAELEVMIGLGARLTAVKWCYLEVNLDALYAQIPLRDEVDAFLRARGFTRIVEAIHERFGWGDALYANGQAFPPEALFRHKLAGAKLRTPSLSPLDLCGPELVAYLKFGAPPPDAGAPSLLPGDLAEVRRI